MAKSAIMTSARQDLLKTIGDEDADPFDIGAGALVPAGAFAPGLAYDAGFFDYLAFSCGNNVQLVSDSDCALLESFGFSSDGSDLNLASIGVAELVGSQTVTRTVTSVTPGTTTFDAVVEAPSGINVAVSPMQLVLDEGESATFTVELSPAGDAAWGEWTFGALTWANDAGVSYARSPIAVRPALSSKADLFNKMVDLPTAVAGDTLTYEVSVTNGPLAGPITVSDVLPAGTTFVEGSETEVVEDGSTSSAWAYDEGTNSLTWTGELAQGQIEVASIGNIIGYLPLSDFFEPFGFPGNCDDGAWGLDVPPFVYNGETYSSVIFSVNGTIEVGQASGLASSFDNQNLPDATLPNNILAPFWRDLNGCDGGNLYVGVLNFGGGYVFTIYEWEDVPFFGSPDAVTMQVWIANAGTPTDVPQAFFTYGRLDNTSDGATVGAENSSGSIGSSYFYNGAGTAPEVGTDLSVLTLPGGSATLGFQVTTDCSEDSVVNQAELTGEAGSATAVAVTACQ